MKFRVSDESGRNHVMAYLSKLQDGKVYDVSITLHREKRTVSQNRLYRLWISVISDETGESDRDALHNAIKATLLGTKEVCVGEFKAEAPISTASLNTEQFTLFLERLEAWANTELGIVLPRPSDMWWDDLVSKYENQM